MKLIVATLLLSGLMAGAQAESSGDPLDSAECRAARAELEQALEAPAAQRRERLERARRQARDVCLGRASADPQRAGAPDVPVVVPAPILAVPRPAPLPAIAPAPPPVVTVPRATAITACDPGGCWDSEGRRLNQTGPVLIGPTGSCTVQAGRVTCP